MARRRRKKRIPDWIIYAVIVAVIYMNAATASKNIDISPTPPPPELGPILPSEQPWDKSVLVEIGKRPKSGMGTAFAIDNKGSWITARHVVDSCDAVGLNLGDEGLKTAVEISKTSDTALLTAPWRRKPLPVDLDSQRQIGEVGYFFGFPQGRPGDVIGSLLGRNRLIVTGRYKSEEAILAWTEIGRSRGLRGSLGGLSGAPVLDSDGEVVGVVSAESPRRGRIYTVAPASLKPLISESDTAAAQALELDSYMRQADAYRRERRIAQVICLVD